MNKHLTREEEEQLFREYRRTNQRKLEERLLASQMGLVWMLARANWLRGVDLADLVQEGAMGLLKAIRRFDSARGVRLSTYAVHWIRAFQLRYLMRNYRLVKLGTTQAQRRLFFRLLGLRNRLSATGVEPTAERMAELLEVDVPSVREMMLRMGAREQSLDAPLHASEPEARVAHLPANGVPADIAAEQSELAAIVRAERERYRATLTPRRRALFDARWVEEDAPTLKAMGDQLGVSRERARQLEQKMLTELRARVDERLAA